MMKTFQQVKVDRSLYQQVEWVSAAGTNQRDNKKRENP